MTHALDRIRHATPAQLRRAADVELWRGGAGGADVRFDAERFGEWLEVLVDAGADVAIRQLSALDLDLVVVGVAEHVRVFDSAAQAAAVARAEHVDVGGYAVVARPGRVCQSVVETLAMLHDEDPAFFHRVMRACVRLSNDGFEDDGLHGLLLDREQAMFDLRAAREERREQQGFVTPAEARAFLAGTGDTRSALFRAYLRGTGAAPDVPDTASDTADAPVEPDARPRALLGRGSGGAPRLDRLHTLLHVAQRTDAAAFAARLRELSFLANVLGAGCTVQGRGLTPAEAADAAASTCHLALTARRSVPDRLLVEHDLLALFGEGWTLVRERACASAARHLLTVVRRIEYHEPETHKALVELRRSLTHHLRARTPWRAAPFLDVVAVLNTPAWAALAGLIAECPVLHGAVSAIVERQRTAIDATAFAFFSETAQLDVVDAFLDRLAEVLTG